MPSPLEALSREQRLALLRFIMLALEDLPPNREAVIRGARRYGADFPFATAANLRAVFTTSLADLFFVTA